MIPERTFIIVAADWGSQRDFPVAWISDGQVSGRSMGKESDGEIAKWYQTQSTVLIQDQLETLPAAVGAKLRRRVAARQVTEKKAQKSPRF